MNLEDFIKDIDNIDETLIVFQKGELNICSEVALFEEGLDDNVIIVKGNTKYLYLIEVSIAKEFVSDWVASLKAKPSISEIAERLFQYAINDA